MTALTTLSAEITALMADATLPDGTAIAGLTWELGRRAVSKNASPPRVVWMPRGASPKGPVKSAFPSQARSVATRSMELLARCWGADVDATDAIVQALIAAAHRRWPGRSDYLGEEWDIADAQIELGELVVVRFTVDLAVLDRTPTTARVTSATFDPSAATRGDGLLNPGDT